MLRLYSCSWEISWFSALHSIFHTPWNWENWGSRRFLSPMLRNNWTKPGTYLTDTARRPHGLDFKSKWRTAILVLLWIEHNLSVSRDSIWKFPLSCELPRGQGPNLAVVLRSGGFWNFLGRQDTGLECQGGFLAAFRGARTEEMHTETGASCCLPWEVLQSSGLY